MQVSIRRLGNFAIPGLFRELRWLSLMYRADAMCLRSICESLQNLPNLQSLHLIGIRTPSVEAEINNLEPIMFNKLIVLFSNCPLLHLINAPKLSYLQVMVDPIWHSGHSSVEKTYGHFCGFDFSKITRIRSGIGNGVALTSSYIAGYPASGGQDVDDVFCPLSDDYCFRHSFHLNQTLAFSYPDQFRLSFSKHWDLIPMLVLFLEKSINLVEIVLTEFNLSSLNRTQVTSVRNGLKNATGVRALTVLSGDSLEDLCNLLGDWHLLPSLERLNYSASDNEKTMRLRGISPMFLKQLLRRSRDAPLEIITECSKPLKMYARYLLSSTVVTRVKTLNSTHPCFPRRPDFDRCRKLSSDLLSSFPSLEYVFCSAPIDCISVSIQPRLKAMQVSIYRLGNFAIPGFFRELRWLVLAYRADIMSLRSLVEALQNLPNLQYLHLFGVIHPFLGEEAEDLEPVTLNELTVLVSNCPLLHLINAPKLSYLQVENDTVINSEHYHSFSEKPYGHSCGFDFSKITRIRSEMTHRRMKSYYYITGNPKYEGEDVDDEFRPLSEIYCYGPNFNFNKSLATYYPDQFRVSLSECWELIQALNLYFEKSINLVEIVLTRFNLSCLNLAEVASFSHALRSATTVRNLTIISGDSLEDLCNLLSNEELLPGLERLNYSASNSENTYYYCYIPNCVLTLVKKRLERSLTMPLKIELGNFPPFQPQELIRLKNLGLEVIQKEGKFEIIADPGPREKKLFYSYDFIQECIKTSDYPTKVQESKKATCPCISR
ncbi:hypothetical protein Clacol_008735 [Clathrus columnatus]|uniref:Uncharacterized protein n=1 Tax=Clathrus columnatus TaxID=1419009 RepID=A0AAV5ANK3_9AGAM|nr:hypothetical protein Clacol_008735 [Clathrus columnatus]